MQRKKIEAIPPIPAPKGKHKELYMAAVDVVTIKNKQILLMDIYRREKRKEALLRICLSENDYENYNYIDKTWNRRMYENGGFRFIGYIEPFYRKSLFVSETDKAKISNYTKTSNHYPIDSIRNYQRNITYEKSRNSRKIREDALQNRCKHINDMPEEYNTWVSDVLLNTHYLYYKRTGNKVRIKCSNCNKSYEYRTKPTTGAYEENFERWGTVPHHNARGRCSECDVEGIYKSEGKQNGMKLSKNSFIIQEYKDDKDKGIVIRYFENVKLSRFNELKAYEEEANTEMARTYFMYEKKKVQTDYHKCNPWSGKNFWDDCNLYGLSSIKINPAAIYPDSFDTLSNSEYKYSGIEAYMKDYDIINPVDYINAYRNVPALEMISKTGMRYLVREIVSTKGFTGMISRDEQKIENVLKIKKQDLKYLISKRGNIDVLKVLQLEKETGQTFDNELRERLTDLRLNYDNMKNILEFVSAKKIVNRACTYAGINYDDELCTDGINAIGNKAAIYIDYLNMLKDMGYDMTNEINLHPRDLAKEHNKLVIQQNKAKMQKEIQKKLDEYPEIKKCFKELNKQYGYETQEYNIRPAKDAEEIILEGKTLHHCVGGDNFLNSHNKLRTIILFMRPKKAPKVPYITIELDTASKKVLQWHGMNNSQPDRPNIEKILNEYTKKLETA